MGQKREQNRIWIWEVQISYCLILWIFAKLTRVIYCIKFLYTCVFTNSFKNVLALDTLIVIIACDIYFSLKMKSTSKILWHTIVKLKRGNDQTIFQSDVCGLPSQKGVKNSLSVDRQKTSKSLWMMSFFLSPVHYSP